MDLDLVVYGCFSDQHYKPCVKTWCVGCGWFMGPAGFAWTWTLCAWLFSDSVFTVLKHGVLAALILQLWVTVGVPLRTLGLLYALLAALFPQLT